MIVMGDGDMRFKAFSLIELMVVLAVITIIATASVPQVQIWTARNRGVQAVSQIISDFSKARSIAGYTVVSDLGKIEYESGEDANIGVRLQTAIMYRESNYSILQRSSMITSGWSDVAGDVLKKTILPRDVVIKNVNKFTTSDDHSFTPVITITSNGKIRNKDYELILGSPGEECAGVQSPINNKVLVVVLTSTVRGSTTNNIWYRIEIDQTGEYFVCTAFGSGGDSPDFKDTGIANVLEI